MKKYLFTLVIFVLVLSDNVEKPEEVNRDEVHPETHDLDKESKYNLTNSNNFNIRSRMG